MNQILLGKFKKKNRKTKYIILFYLSFVLVIVFTIYFVLFYYNITRKEKLSKLFLTNFNIENLYPKKNTSELNNNIFIIGIIEIPKINIEYPIISTVGDELLKISPCRFCGPLPNNIGNLCIAAHNYDDDRFFGNLYKLKENDRIIIHDLNNNSLVYSVYKKYEISAKDTSCTNQYTNNKREITLVTCNNKNKNRLIVKACE